MEVWFYTEWEPRPRGHRRDEKFSKKTYTSAPPERTESAFAS